MQHNPFIPKLTNGVGREPARPRPPRQPLKVTRRDGFGVVAAVATSAALYWASQPILTSSWPGDWDALTSAISGGASMVVVFVAFALASGRKLPVASRLGSPRGLAVLDGVLLTVNAALAFMVASVAGVGMWLFGAGCLTFAAWWVRLNWARPSH